MTRLSCRCLAATVQTLRRKRPQPNQRTFSIAIDLDDDFLKPFRRVGYNFIRCGIAEREVSDLTKMTREQKRKIPKGYLNFFARDASGQVHLRWMLQKDALQQDVMLTSSGGVGAVRCRRMVMAYAELVQRPVEVITVSPDTTIENILQRQTIRSNSSYSALNCVDMAGVRAALEGHILLVDGLHRAERNASSVLTSLLARREVRLRDGRVLISADDYQSLKKDNLLSSSPDVAPINEDFRIFALWCSNRDRLDPSVRSHFQIQRVEAPPCGILYEQLLINHGHDSLEEPSKPSAENIAIHAFTIPDSTKSIAIPNVSEEKSARELSTLVSIMNDSTLNKNRSFCFPLEAMHAIHRLRIHFPQIPLSDLLYRAYPYASMEPRIRKLIDAWPMGAASRTLLRQVCQELGTTLESTGPSTTMNNTNPYALVRVEPHVEYSRKVLVHFSRQKSFKKEGIFASMFNDFSYGDVVVQVRSGGLLSTQTQLSRTNLVTANGTNEVLIAMIQEHFADRDILLVGPSEDDKITIAKQFCSLLGYDAHVLTIHKDMKGINLFWKLSSDNSHIWTETPLLTAAKRGQVCILDGIEKLSTDTISMLQGFITDRELLLSDSIRYSHNISVENVEENVRKVHHSFRVIAVASIASLGTLNTYSPPLWLSEEVVSMFATISLPPTQSRDGF